MTDKKDRLDEGYQPIKKGYQPKPQKKEPGGGVKGGYQPNTGKAEPNPPPKKP